MKNHHPNSTSGVIYGILSFSAWGLLPLYWKALIAVPSLEVLAHRIVWSLVFVLLLLTYKKQVSNLVQVMKDAHSRHVFVATSLLIGGNWFLYIWAVNSGHVLETSLGYFINPLISVLFGYLFLKERLSRGQTIALLLATLGVLNLTINFGTFPWIALSLAMSFGIYGLLRKTARADSLVGLSFETLVLSPVALGFLIWLEFKHQGALGHSIGIDAPANWTQALLLIGAGIVTACPLLWFAYAARRLKLSTVGFLQYLAPTGQFLLAVFVFKETFTKVHFLSFGLIWAALILYSFESWRQLRRAGTYGTH